jgi:Mechanosensitive ion channel
MSSMRLVIAVDAETLTATTIDPWNVVLAVAVAIVGWILSRVTRKAVGKLLTRLQGLSDDLRDLAARAAGYVVLFVGFGIALSIIGVPIQPLLTAVIVIGVVLALALRGIAENFAAGIVLQTRRPIEVGDEVDSLDYVGDVVEMNGRAVIIETFDGRRVHLPNSEVLSNPLVNHTERGARGRRRGAQSVSGIRGDSSGSGRRRGSGARCPPRAATGRISHIDRPGAGDCARPVLASAAGRFDGAHRCDPGPSRTGRQRTEMATIVAPQPAPPLTPSPWI